MRLWTWSVAACFAAGLVALPGCSGDETVAPGADTSSADSASDGTADTDGSDGTGTDDVVDNDTTGTDGDSTGTEPDGTSDSEDIPDVIASEDDGGGADSDDAGDLPDVIDVDGADGTTGDVDPGDADTGPEDVPLTELQQCVLDNKCDEQPIVSVCDVNNKTDVYPNDCYFFCAKGTYDNIALVTSPECQLECQWNDCDPDWSALQPVCVEDPDETLKEYSSPYAACCSDGHYLWLTDPRVKPGKCPSDIACGEGCPADFSPVCGKDKTTGATLTYKNSCEISTCGVDLECNAPCADSNGCPQCAQQSACAPVCGLDGNTYRNECYAKCLGKTTPEYVGACCDCPPAAPDTYYCSLEGTTHGNLCTLTCKGETPAYQGPCVDGCTVDPLNDPPDGACGFYQNQFTKFPNVSCATKAGATCVYEGACSPGTNECATTNQEYQPVCAQAAGDTPKTYANPCNAGCAAAEIQSAGVCADCTTLCPPGEVGTTKYCGPDCVLYDNDCIATKCIGFELDQLTKSACPASCTPAP